MIIYSINKEGIWEKIDNESFPNYTSLSVIEEKKRELSKTTKKRRNVDIFLWICIGAALITCGLFILSLFDLIKLDDKEMSLLLITIGLVIIPFVAKLEILGIVLRENQRSNSTSPNIVFTLRSLTAPWSARRFFKVLNHTDNPANLTAQRPALLGLKVLGLVNTRDVMRNQCIGFQKHV